MKIQLLTAVLVMATATTQARAAMALVLFSSKDADMAQMALDEWKNEKVLVEKLLVTGSPELTTADQLHGLTPGHTAVVLGVCETADAEAVLPILTALYPHTAGKTVEAAATTCPKLVSTPTKLVSKLTEKSGNVTLQVALFQGSWDKDETTQMAVGHVRDKDGDLVDTYAQRAGTVMGGEKCTADLKQVGHAITINRHCEGTKDVETKKLSLAKGRLKIE